MDDASLRAVPVIDIAPYLAGAKDERRRVAEAVGQACEEVGFLIVTGHGVAPEQIEHTAAVARPFFDLPDEEKWKLPLTPGGAGYSPLQGERLAASLGQVTPADLKESLNVAAGFESTPWPPPDLLKSATIAATSFAICVGLYEFLLRRINVLRVLFGMKPAARPAPVQWPTALPVNR